MIPQDFVDSLLAATDITAVIGEFVPSLRRRGGEYVGLCPFHSDSTPSLAVSPTKGVYICRSCSASGNTIKFLMEHTGMTFPEAIEKLAKAASMTVPTTGNRAHPLSDDTVAVLGVLERAAALYRDALKTSKTAQDYITKRGVDEATGERFRLGFSPGSNFIMSQMKDVAPELLIKAGLITKPEEDKPSREWMSGRVVFPIRNAQGRVIGFGGRTIDDQAQKRVKYINTPETVVFKKGRELYGLFESGNDIRKKNQALVFEGYLDVVVCNGHGVNNAVCLMGTSISDMSVQKLYRAADKITYCLDADAAGKRAAIRAMDTSLPMISATKSATFMFLPDGMDPDDYVKQHSAREFYQLMEKSEPLSKFMLRVSGEGIDLGNAEGRAKYATVMMERINKIGSPVMRSMITEELRKVVGQGVRLVDSGPEPVRRDAAPDHINLGRRILTNAMKDPRILAEFDIDFLRVATASAEEIETICEIARIIKDIPDEHRHPSIIMDRLAGTPFEKILSQACSTDEAKTQSDPAQQMADITLLLGQRWSRQAQLEALQKMVHDSEATEAAAARKVAA